MSPARPQPAGDDPTTLDAAIDALLREGGPESSGGPTADPMLVDLASFSNADWEAAAPFTLLAEMAGADGIEAGDVHAAPPSRPMQRRTAWRVVAIAAALVVLAAGLTGFVERLGQPAGNRSGGQTLATWRLAGYLDEPSWSAEPASVGSAVTVTCPTPANCYADAPGAQTSVVAISGDGGASWRLGALPPGVRLMTALTCPAPEQCLAGATLQGETTAPGVVSTENGGETWTETPLPSALSAVVGVACGSTSRCVALGAPSAATGSPDVAVSRDAGQTWTVDATPGPFLPYGPEGLTCTAALVCVAVGTTGYGRASTGASTGSGVVLTSVDGGQTWSRAVVPTGTALVQAVSCSGTRCTALARDPARPAPGTAGAEPYGPSTVLVSTDRGTSWSAAPDAGLVPSSLSSLSCPSPSDCWAAGSRWTPGAAPGTGAVIVRTADGATNWSVEQLPTTQTAAERAASHLAELDLQAVVSISCPVVGSCVAIGLTGSLSTPVEGPVALSSQGA